jgi:hypothetical protein
LNLFVIVFLLQKSAKRRCIRIWKMNDEACSQPIEEIEANLLPSAKAALDELAWWAKATMAAKADA